MERTDDGFDPLDEGRQRGFHRRRKRPPMIKVMSRQGHGIGSGGSAVKGCRESDDRAWGEVVEEARLLARASLFEANFPDSYFARPATLSVGTGSIHEDNDCGVADGFCQFRGQLMQAENLDGLR
jgi:hypothetical protein